MYEIQKSSQPEAPGHHVLAIRHVHFESLGTFETVLKDSGYSINYVDVGHQKLTAIDPSSPDLLVILGGPMGVYDTPAYPFLETEKELIRARLQSGLPMLGICLGAQLIAAVLGATIAPSGVKEIGFAPIELTPAGSHGPLRHLDGVPVLHWHGDAFTRPQGAELLATTTHANQAFSLGSAVLGLQFHPEAETDNDLEAWLIGHAAELGAAGIDLAGIRADARRFGPGLKEAAVAMFAEWVAQLPTTISSPRRPIVP